MMFKVYYLFSFYIKPFIDVYASYWYNHQQALFLVLAGIFLNSQGAVVKRGVEALSGKNPSWTYDGN